MNNAQNRDGMMIPLDHYTMTWEDVERFLDGFTKKGRSEATVARYRRYMEMLYEFLPEDKNIQRGTLALWREDLAKRGYSPSSLNIVMSVCDRFLAFVDCREYQIGDRLEKQETLQPVLTRNEYMRLLATAKSQGDERLYLLVKTLACVGIHLQELKDITVQNVQSGRFELPYQGARRIVLVPGCLQRELLSYADKRGISADPTAQIFLTERGVPINRSYITEMITRLCEAAQVPVEKGNPRCLRRLYQATWDGIRSNMEFLLEQALERQIEEEQLTVGWDS